MPRCFSSDEIWEKVSGLPQRGIFIIAEAGKNFITTKEEQSIETYLENAKKLVDAAKACGADAIKFQTHNVEDEQLDIEITAPHFKGADRYSWVKRNTNATPVERFWKPLKEYCDKKEIVFMSTPMSRGAASKLMEVGVPFWKIGSGDILDFVCMDYLRNTGVPVIMSSGMSTLEEVEKGLQFLQEKNKRVALMHTLSKYPGTKEEANLNTIDLFREKFPNIPIGFSENSVGIEPSLIAVARGATFIEKHFTLDRNAWGADHKVCSTPEEFKELVQEVRRMESDENAKKKWLEHPDIALVLGKKEKVLRDDEAVFRPVFRKALMAGSDIPAGTVIAKEMIYAMRPQSYTKGFPSEEYETILGKRVKRDLEKYDPFTQEVLI